MPGGDRTGPAGAGPMTGKKMGYCTGNDFEGSQVHGRGMAWRRGFGRGRGRSFGFRYRGGTSDDPEKSSWSLFDEINKLKNRLSSLEQLLKDDKKDQ